MSSPPIREGPHEKGYMAALAAHVQLYGSVDETTLHLVAFPPGMTTKPHDAARVMQELAPAYGLRADQLGRVLPLLRHGRRDL